MLQPLQLQDVSLRYAADIEELRTFLTQAGLHLASPESLAAIAARLHRDPAFRRDFTCTLWVVLHAHPRMSYADLLGMLALAATDPGLAAATPPETAHALLRFLMDARDSLEGAPVPPDDILQPAESLPVFPVGADRATGVAAARTSAPVAELSVLQTETVLHRGVRRGFEQSAPGPLASRRRSRLAWAIAACVLGAVSLSVGLHFRSALLHSASRVGQRFDPVIPRAAVPSQARQAEPQVAVGSTNPVVSRGRAYPHVPARATVSGVRPKLPATTPRLGLSAESPASAATPALTPAPTATPPAGWSPPGTLRPQQAVTAIPARSTVPGVVPAAVLSKRLGARSLPAYAADQTTAKANSPHLLRRHPFIAAAEEDAIPGESQVPANPAARTATRAGTVRPTAIGIMAGNVVYSPAPPYPADASAAHVQGEVRVQAQIDRDGNVTAARVVSGPPLLRDAARDAVEHWRYRPYMASGRPAPATAVAVLEFQLP